MPEVVEVRRFADLIGSKSKNHKITDVEILAGRYKTHKPFEGYELLKDNLPLYIVKAESKGKLIYVTFQNEKKTKTFYMLSTLGLSGGWTFTQINGDSILVNVDDFEMPRVLEFIGAKTIQEWKVKTIHHLNVRFQMKDHGELYFFDMLSFGTLKVTDDIKILEKKLKELGLDILDAKTTVDAFLKQIRKKIYNTKPIGNVIVNQKIISGVGNYLRADCLWMAKISPFRTVTSLSDKELNSVFTALKELVLGDYSMEEGRKQGYITQHTKLPKDYKRDFFVYSEKTDIHGNPVKKEELFEGSQKRSIFWCPAIQK
jgi:formamidopyrimidine-DNA glycosylase